METTFNDQCPILAPMVKDIFSIPASGLGVERLFNKERDIAHYPLGRLNAKKIEMLMMLRMHPNQNEISVTNMEPQKQELAAFASSKDR